MPISLPLDKMTVEEKLQIMEAIWEDLTRDAASFESPAWLRLPWKNVVSRKPVEKLLTFPGSRRRKNCAAG